MYLDSYRHDPRRFLVVTDRLALYSGVYHAGEVITDDQAGTARDLLIDRGMLREADYDLRFLNEGPKML